MTVGKDRAHEMGGQTIDALEKRMEDVAIYSNLTTDELGEFWRGALESCLLRVVKLKPEMVTKLDE